MNILENLSRHVSEYAKNVENGREKPLALIVTGAAMEVFRLPQTPGSTKILTAIFVPYCWEQSVDFIAKHLPLEEALSFKDRAVSANSAKLLCQAGLKEWPNCKIVAVTGATTTTRYRRGENHAYVSCGTNSVSKEWVDGEEQDVDHMVLETYHVKLPKLSEEEHNMCNGDVAWVRADEDRAVANFALGLAFGKIRKVENTE